MNGSGLKLTIEDDRLKTLGPKTHRLLGLVVRAAAENIRRNAVESIHDGPKTGRIYELGESEVSFVTKAGQSVAFTARKGQESQLHQASAPGEAPANETGNLAGSIQTKHGENLSSEVTVGAASGAALEFGTTDGKLAPRPFIGPAVESERPYFYQAAESVLTRAAE